MHFFCLSFNSESKTICPSFNTHKVCLNPIRKQSKMLEVQVQYFLSKRENSCRLLYQNILMESWVWWEKVHKQQGRTQPWKDCWEKPIQELKEASQGVDWGWGQECHAQTCPGNELRMLHSQSQATPETGRTPEKELGRCSSGPQASFQLRATFAFHLEFKVPEWSFHSQWGLGSSAAVGPLSDPECTLPSTRSLY